jgi:hypothetical protein
MKLFNSAFGCNIGKTQEFEVRERLKVFNKFDFMFFFLQKLLCSKPSYKNYKGFVRKKNPALQRPSHENSCVVRELLAGLSSRLGLAYPIQPRYC